MRPLFGGSFAVPRLIVSVCMLALLLWWTTAPATAATPTVRILTANPVPAAKFALLAEAGRKAGVALEHRYAEQLSPDEAAGWLAGAAFVIVDAPRAHIVDFVMSKLGPAWAEARTPRVLLMTEGARAFGTDAAFASSLNSYYQNGGVANFDAAMRLIAARQLKLREDATIPPPIVFPKAAWYHPKLPQGVSPRMSDLPGRSDVPQIAIALHQAYVSSGETAFIDALIRDIEGAGGRALPFYTPMMEPDAFTRLLAPAGKPVAQVLINTQIVLDAQARKAEFEKLGIPVLQTMAYRKGDAAEWARDREGVSLMDVPFYLAQPEIAGTIDPMVAAAVAKPSGRTEPIAAQVRSVVGKAINIARLQTTPAADKRVAILFYNYPPGERNLSASFMNLPASLHNTLAAMKQHGYSTDAPDEKTLIEQLGRLLAPFYRDGQLEPLLDAGLAAWLPMRDYRRWFDAQTPELRAEVSARWGKPEASAMATTRKGEAGFVIPRLALGNVVLMPVPPRGERDEAKEKAIYHNTKEPLNHFYLAAYLWAREGRNALVHYGTHGTQEWTPGKERGLAVSDQPFVVLGDVPVIYPYIVDDVGEAIQAKRRGRATIVSHQTPAFRPAGLHTELNDLHDLLHQVVAQEAGSVRERLVAQLLDRSDKLHLFADLGTTRAAAQANMPAWLNQMHDHLHALASQLQPIGLHTFGRAQRDEVRLFSTMAMLGKDFLARVFPEEPEELFAQDFSRITESKPFTFLKPYVLEGRPISEIRDAKLREDAERAQRYFAALDPAPELAGLLAALDGKHLASSTGGDPIRNPDSLTTGRNLYGFDPSKVPSKAAWEAGLAATEALLKDHRARKGSYPSKLAFNLWSVETMRHAGILEAQAMAPLGVRPKWDEGGRLVGVELIPAKELGRPRVDVVLSATGLYRDHFPNVMKWLSQAVKLAAAADEPDNAVAASTRAIRSALAAKGLPAAKLDNLALTRIFSSESGAYGTGLDEATLATDTWGNDAGEARGDRRAGEAKMAQLYLAKMQFGYGPDEAEWGSKLEGGNLYAENLKGVQAALLARSSNLYGMLTTDDPFQYLGGLGLAVRHLTGKSPELLISNLRDPRDARTETAAGFLSTELRTRQFHPGWIQAMQAEGYSGALNVLDAVNNFWGWTAVAPEIVRDDQWQEFAEVYVRDKYKLGVNEWFEREAPQAQAQIIERMLEAARKGYWKTDEKTVRELAQRWQQLASKHELRSDNAKFSAYVAEQAQGATPAGYGVARQAATPAAAAPAPSPAPSPAQTVQPPMEAVEPKVQGMVLEQKKPHVEAAPVALSWLIGGALMLFALLSGAVRQFARPTARLLDLPARGNAGAVRKVA